MFFLTVFLFTGCGLYASLKGGRRIADDLAVGQGWEHLSFDTGMFVLTGYAKRGIGTDLVVYIEGDGDAWINRRRPSTDPTPRNPLALRLALEDPAPMVLYLGRPCQYTSEETMKGCHYRFWTISRFSPVVIEAMDRALAEAKGRLGAGRLHLIGYSGGGAVAVLLASRRRDVASIITVAANLDHEAWTRFHKVTPLRDSLNPTDVTDAVRACPQVHIAGSEDDIMPPMIAESYMHRMGTPSKAEMVIIRGVDHRCCWVDRWPGILKTYRTHLEEPGSP